ncbi:ribosomal L7Ae/L30e/S12e/Gadd45 family protein [Candidatus Woesearchaeota archaeon]|nr:ribosomal L7Ae/L30e/S12e/Gadd45 family protein [Candidatus Woesearchaeota archaeon]
MSDLKKVLKEQKITIGSEETIKKLKIGKVKKVFLASNCPQKTKTEIMHLAKLANASIEELGIPNEEVGMICKKGFRISVLSC